jgi:SAM-dependent methyltransferase
VSSARVQQRRWVAQVQPWHAHVTSVPVFDQLRHAILRHAEPRPSDLAVDLGAGTGFLSLALAPQVARVLCVDVAQPMIDRLRTEVFVAGRGNVELLCSDIAAFALPAASVDLVVSSYALHHLSDRDKRAVLQHARDWLRPGGRIVLADWMLGRGRSRRDRAILWAMVRRLVGKGPRGWWRMLRNLVQLSLGVGPERPVSPDFWVGAMQAAGFTQVCCELVGQAAGLVAGRVPDPDRPAGAGRPSAVPDQTRQGR